MKLFVTGGTGFIGRPLCQSLTAQGHELVVVTRQPDLQPVRAGVMCVSWDGTEWQRALNGADGVINLAGEPIVARRWTPRQKVRLWDSRVGTTQRLVKALAVCSSKPGVLINASAIGYYGACKDEQLSEEGRLGQGFLSEMCQAWEAQASRAEPLGIRVVRLRIGLVLGRGGGALAKMVPPFRWYLGGPLGSGRQWMSWIHRDDLIGLIRWALESPDVSGALNGTAPEPVRMREFSSTLGRVLRRPSWAPVPGFVLRLLLGEMADLLLTGQRVLPQAALRQGFTFQYPQLHQSLKACLTTTSTKHQAVSTKK